MVDVAGRWTPDAERLRWDLAARRPRRPAAFSQPPTLASLCIKSLAKAPRAFSAAVLETVSGSVAARIWQGICEHGYDSLETWLLFAEIHGADVLAAQSKYPCCISTQELGGVDVHLKGLMRTQLPESVALSVVVCGPLDISTEFLSSIVSLNQLCILDLRAAKWPSDLDEIDRGLKMLRQSMTYGSLRPLLCLRLPQKGPAYLKRALKLKWPRTLQYYQCPVKPEDAKQNWRRVSSFNLDSIDQTVEFLVTRSKGDLPVMPCGADSCFARI